MLFLLAVRHTIEIITLIMIGHKLWELWQKILSREEMTTASKLVRGTLHKIFQSRYNSWAASLGNVRQDGNFSWWQLIFNFNRKFYKSSFGYDTLIYDTLIRESIISWERDNNTFLFRRHRSIIHSILTYCQGK